MTDINPEIIPLLSSISAVFFALVYAHIVIKLCQSKNVLINLLAATGKVAFSLYILQSLVMGVLLRWLIPEFSLTASHPDYLVIALAYTFIQIVIANLYMRKFEQGPLEQLWRTRYNRSINKKLKAQLKV